MFDLLWPYALLLLPLPLLARYLLPEKSEQQAALKVSDLKRWSTANVQSSGQLNQTYWVWLLPSLAWCLLMGST